MIAPEINAKLIANNINSIDIHNNDIFSIYYTNT